MTPVEFLSYTIIRLLDFMLESGSLILMCIFIDINVQW